MQSKGTYTVYKVKGLSIAKLDMRNNRAAYLVTPNFQEGGTMEQAILCDPVNVLKQGKFTKVLENHKIVLPLIDANTKFDATTLFKTIGFPKYRHTK